MAAPACGTVSGHLPPRQLHWLVSSTIGSPRKITGQFAMSLEHGSFSCPMVETAHLPFGIGMKRQSECSTRTHTLRN